MWSGLRISVVVPCFREEQLVGKTLQGLPSWVDHICAVDDASDDSTCEAIQRVEDPRVELVRHPRNLGVGAAITTGYRRALAHGTDICVVMAGDNQMDPADLPALIEPIVRGEAHYTKGNRFRHPERRRMPWVRRVGGMVLSLATRLTTGLPISDSQCGYTALSVPAASLLPLGALWPRYGYPNDLLGMLSARELVVKEVTVRPVYATEQSGIRFWHLLVVLWVILRRYCLERLGGVYAPQESTQHAE